MKAYFGFTAKKPNSENDEGRTEYFDKYQEAKNQLKEMRKGKEARCKTPPPTFTAKITDSPANLYPEVVVMQPNGLTGISIEEDTIRTGLKKIRGKKLEMKSLPQIDGPTDPSSDFETTDEGSSPITKGKTKKVKRLRRKDVKEDTSSPEEEEEGKTPPKIRGNNSKEKERNPSKQASRGKKIESTAPAHYTGREAYYY
ncbi:hypothetical protein JTB14_015690 [Gonioctena quinquepunctata]|nr:hypothetical protein JTB14_015690 [Gonioctena quinquepunctata]